MKAGAWKSAHVMASSLIQATLVDYLVSSGRISEERVLASTFPQLLEICRQEQVLTTRTVDLATFIRPYSDFLSPDSRTRLQAATDETGARIAQALLEIVINEVSAHKRDVYQQTAEQIVAKLQSDPSSVAIMSHLLRKLNRVELKKLLLDLVPRAYYEAARPSDQPPGEILRNLEQCFREAFDLAPADLKILVAKRFLQILENESEYIVQCYESAFFRGSDLRLLDQEERTVVKTHLFSSLSKRVTRQLVDSSSGIAEFLETESDARSYFAPLVLRLLEVHDDSLAAAIIKRISEEFRLLSEGNRKSIWSWIGRLGWSLRKKGREHGAAILDRLESDLAT